MKVIEILEQYDEYEDDGPDSLQVSFTLVAPEEYQNEQDNYAEVTMDVDVEVEETEREGQHVFSQGGFEVTNAWFADDYVFMGAALTKGLDMPPQFVPYIEFSEDDERAMDGIPTANMREHELEEMFRVFVESRIKGEVTVPEKKYPAQW